MIYNLGSGSGGASTADRVEYDNTDSSLESTNVQGAIDELDGALDTVNSDLGGVQFGINGDGKRCYRGADGSLIPFSAGVFGTFTTAAAGSAANINLGFNPKMIMVCMVYNNAGVMVYRYDVENNRVTRSWQTSLDTYLSDFKTAFELIENGFKFYCTKTAAGANKAAYYMAY